MKKITPKVSSLKSLPNSSTKNSFANESSISEVSALIASELKDVSSTFNDQNGWILCDVGGTFQPTCREMELVLEKSSIFNKFEHFSNMEFEEGVNIHFDSAYHRLYYDSLRRNTNIEFFSVELQGHGKFELNLSAQTEHQVKWIASFIIELDNKTGLYLSEPIEVNTLLANGSLVLSLCCLSDSGLISSARWKGHVRTNFINSGERIVAIRTFGNRASVAASLKAIVNRLAVTHPDILQRHLFVIYDATDGTTGSVVSDYVGNARIIELRAPNFGGGGNASALVSMLLRAGQISDNKISEVILFDDDAHIDAETIVRHDAFVTARKQGVVSTSVIYSSERPFVIQEFGGIWGKMFSSNNHGIAVSEKDSPRLFIPYLVRCNRNVDEQYNAKYIGKHQDIEFSTFIFISFPYECLSKVGAPLPVFLRNDDVEICLRMLENNYKIIVNPNLSAWHDSAHNPIGEFYATLHGLIVNSRYGGICRSYFYSIFMQRISSLNAAGNLVLLVAYTKALELFATGPDWMSTESIYNVYAGIRLYIDKTMKQYARQVPYEVVEHLKSQGRICIRNIVDPTPMTLDVADVVFMDTKNDLYYSFKHTELDESLTGLLEQCLDHLHYISNNFDVLTKNWSNYVTDFNHLGFWDELLGENGIWVTANTNFDKDAPLVKTYIQEKNIKEKRLKFSSAKVADELSAGLPSGFNAENYLRLNPDIASANADPVAHWITHGCHENRPY